MLVTAVFLAASSARAAPPALDLTPLFGDNLVQGVWQPVTVTLSNPPDGEALRGEVEVVVEEPRTGQRLGQYAAPVLLPRGAGVVSVSVPVHVPGTAQPDLVVFLRRERTGTGDIVTYRKFDRLPVLAERLTMLAVSGTPDALRYLNGVRLGVWQTRGGITAIDPYRNGGYRPGQGYGNRRSSSSYPPPLHVAQIADPATLPSRTAAYEGIGIVYLGADVRPDLFGDAQAEALRRYVVGGGLVIVSAGSRLREDERFRSWIPTVVPGPSSQTSQRQGRGCVVALGFDPSSPEAAARPDLALWKFLVRSATALSRFGTSAYGEDMRGVLLTNAVLRAPGLEPPGAGAVAVFLSAYLVLLVPINYLILKRLDRREWSWATVPALVLLFSVGAYGFGRVTKGSSLLLNTASLAEMTAGSSDASVRTAVGLFSPSRTGYDLSVGVPDALLWTPGADDPYGVRPGGAGEQPLALAEDAAGRGTVARGVAVPMWGMRAVCARTEAVRLGDGLEANLTGGPGGVTGTVTNRTGRPLRNVRVVFLRGEQVLGDLAPGQTAQVWKTGTRLSPPWQATNRSSRYRYSSARGARQTTPAGPPPTGTGDAIARTREGILREIEEFVDTRLYARDPNKHEAYVTAWNDAPLVPVRVDGRVPARQVNVSVLVVRAPVR
jgi:hypothetical protein